MKKKSKIIISFTSVLLAFVLVFNIFYMPFTWLGTRVYAGSRIICNIHITVDGEKANISKNDSFLYILLDKNYGEKLVDRANEYNTFKYKLKINNENDLIITANHWNWWEITRSDLYIDIDTNSNTYTAYEEYKYTAELPCYHIQYENEEKQEYSFDNVVNISIGPKG